MVSRFCLLTAGRSGSSSLMEVFGSFDDIGVPNKNISCTDNELIHPLRIDDYTEQFSKLSGKKITTPDELIDAFYELNAGYAFAGFKSMPNRHRHYDDFISRKDIQFITLIRRDVISTAASFLGAYEVGTWRRHGEARTDQLTFDHGRHGNWVRSNVAYLHESLVQLAMIPDAISLYYEDLCDPLYRCAALDEFFARPIRLNDPRPPTSGAAYISNWKEFHDFANEIWNIRTNSGNKARRTATRKSSSNTSTGSSVVPAAKPEPVPSTVRRTGPTVILYVWELGMDLGHILRFLPLAWRLRDRGHEVVFALRDLQHAESAVGKYGFPVVQAPFWMAVPKNLPNPPLNYAEIILRYGFLTDAGLKGLVKAWRHLYKYVHADLIIADHSPSALLAAYTMDLKRATIGTGFCVPPRVNPTPNMRPWKKVNADRLKKADAVALANANRVIADLGGRPLKLLADLFRVDEEFLCSFSELDHYPNRHGGHYWGPVFNVDEGVKLNWPEGEGRRVFAYLKPGHRDFEVVLKALDKLGIRALVYAPRIPAQLREKYQSARMTISPEPIRLDAILKDCELGICHAGFGTVSAMLLAGIPLLLLPTQLEQLLTAKRVVTLGMGLLADAEQKKKPDYRELLKRLLSESGFLDAARAFAAKYAKFNQTAQVNAMAARIEKILL